MNGRAPSSRVMLLPCEGLCYPYKKTKNMNRNYLVSKESHTNPSNDDNYGNGLFYRNEYSSDGEVRRMLGAVADAIPEQRDRLNDDDWVTSMSRIKVVIYIKKS